MLSVKEMLENLNWLSDIKKKVAERKYSKKNWK